MTTLVLFFAFLAFVVGVTLAALLPVATAVRGRDEPEF